MVETKYFDYLPLTWQSGGYYFLVVTLRFGGLCLVELLLGMQSSLFFCFLLQSHNGSTCQGNNMISRNCGQGYNIV